MLIKSHLLGTIKHAMVESPYGLLGSLMLINFFLYLPESFMTTEGGVARQSPYKKTAPSHKLVDV